MKETPKRALQLLTHVTKKVLPELLVAIPVVGTVASKCTKVAIEAYEEKAKLLQQELKAAQNDKEKALSIAQTQADTLLEMASKNGISEEQLCEMVKDAAISELRKSTEYPVSPVYASGFILWADNDKLSPEVQSTLSDIFQGAYESGDIEYYEDNETANEAVNAIREFIRENIDSDNGHTVSDSFLSFVFDWEKDGYEGYPCNSQMMDALVTFTHHINMLLSYEDNLISQPFYLTYQIY